MPATAADIAAAIRDVIIAQWSDSAIAARYPSARDSLASPADGYFDSLSDASTVATARGALVGTERRRFSVVVQDVVWIDPAAGIPTVTVIDAEQGVNGGFVVCRVEVDLDAETTTFEVFG